MPAAYDYAILRVVPRVERGECVNVGVILGCPALGYLGCKIVPDLDRVRALAPDLDVDAVTEHLRAIERVCRGDPEGGAIAALPDRERFHWLVHPRSTVIQTSAVHSGRADDPEATLDHLFATLVVPGIRASSSILTATGERERPTRGARRTAGCRRASSGAAILMTGERLVFPI